MMPRLWSELSWKNHLLRPLSWLFQGITYLRRQAYETGWLAQYKFPVPVIIIGNLTAGGSGKTPLTISLVQWLIEQGYRPGIVSRGYRSQNCSYPMVIDQQTPVTISGDEAALLAKRCPCPLVLDPNRVRGIKHLLNQFDCNIVLLDDGLQHYALTGTIRVTLVHQTYQFGNGLCLPAGPLREPTIALKRSNYVILNDTSQKQKAKKNEYRMHYQYSVLAKTQSPKNTQTIETLAQKKVYVAAGLGNPQAFIDFVKSYNEKATIHCFPDHYDYQSKDFEKMQDGIVVMTEKDAVKCKTFKQDNLWYLPIQGHLTTNFTRKLIQDIRAFNKNLTI